MDLRMEIAEALMRVGDDESALFEWHPCVEQPNCKAIGEQPQPCPCAGTPYLSETAWVELQPVIRRIQQGAAQ